MSLHTSILRRLWHPLEILTVVSNTRLYSDSLPGTIGMIASLWKIDVLKTAGVKKIILVRQQSKTAIRELMRACHLFTSNGTLCIIQV